MEFNHPLDDYSFGKWAVYPAGKANPWGETKAQTPPVTSPGESEDEGLGGYLLPTT